MEVAQQKEKLTQLAVSGTHELSTRVPLHGLPASSLNYVIINMNSLNVKPNLSIGI